MERLTEIGLEIAISFAFALIVCSYLFGVPL